MNSLFLPYKQSMLLKQIGFKEMCITFYNLDGRLIHNDDWCCGIDYTTLPNPNWRFSCLAPLYQQVVEWFYKKHSINLSLEGKDSMRVKHRKIAEAIMLIQEKQRLKK